MDPFCQRIGNICHIAACIYYIDESLDRSASASADWSQYGWTNMSYRSHFRRHLVSLRTSGMSGQHYSLQQYEIDKSLLFCSHKTIRCHWTERRHVFAHQTQFTLDFYTSSTVLVLRLCAKDLLYTPASDLPCAASPANHRPARPRAQRTSP